MDFGVMGLEGLVGPDVGGGEAAENVGDGSGTGFWFSDDLQKLGCLQPRLCQSPTTIFPHKCLHCKCFWQAPRSKNLNLKSWELPRLRLARAKEAEDSFTPAMKKNVSKSKPKFLHCFRPVDMDMVFETKAVRRR